MHKCGLPPPPCRKRAPAQRAEKENKTHLSPVELDKTVPRSQQVQTLLDPIEV